MLRKLLLIWLGVMMGALALAQASNPKVSWETAVVPADARAAESAMLVLTATIEPGWHIYALQQTEKVKSTEFRLIESAAVKADGDPVQPFPVFKLDPTIDMEVGSFSGQVAYGVPIKLSADAQGRQVVTVQATTQACDDKMCLPPVTDELEITLNVSPGEPRVDRTASLTEAPVQPAGYVDPDAPATTAETPATESGNETSAVQKNVDELRSMPWPQFIGVSILAGLGALLTPCVFPMIPVTVSYFSKRASKEGGSRFAGPTAYSVGMIATFALVGVITAVVAGATGLIRFAQHPVTNVALGVLFIVLALNLFGLFEIQLPSSWVSKANQGRTKGGLVGPFMMGLAFSLTSFTCTVGFVGLLLGAAANNELIRPVVGMTVFGATFALPFFLLALFPGYLNKLPKAGAWMQTTKFFMGFIEIAAALKFLQNADLVWGLGIFTREVFLASWAVVFFCAGFFMLGWLILPKDYGTPIGPFRSAIGAIMVGLGVWSMAGIGGQSLGPLNAYLPPTPYPFANAPKGSDGQVAEKSDGLTWLSSYDEALKQAKETGKPIFIDFTGYT